MASTKDALEALALVRQTNNQGHTNPRRFERPFAYDLQLHEVCQ
jgi:hypothetical protein